ncbi:hypothetical protein JZU71_00510 [bacterium]|nr:hypothetical protein [bacterium]
MLVFLLFVVSSLLCYYLGILSIVFVLLSLFWKLAVVAVLIGAVLLVWRRYHVRPVTWRQP